MSKFSFFENLYLSNLNNIIIIKINLLIINLKQEIVYNKKKYNL